LDDLLRVHAGGGDGERSPRELFPLRPARIGPGRRSRFAARSNSPAACHQSLAPADCALDESRAPRSRGMNVRREVIELTHLPVGSIPTTRFRPRTSTAL